jgi:sugar phosphate isomerase/epimerase
MKIGVFTENLSRWGENRYKMLKDLGYSCVDLGMADTEISPYTLEEPEFVQSLLAERQLIEDAGIEISQVHGPWRWPPEDATPENRAERMEKMRKSIRATAILGCKYWVIHPIMPYGIEDLENGKAQETWDLNLEFMKELLITAKENDVTICFENMPMRKFSLGAPKDTLRFVKAINDEHFKICLDTGHVSVFRGLTPADALRELAEEVRTLHVHDNDGRYDLHLIPHYGVIDWEDFGKALKEVQYQGVFSLETAPNKRIPLEAAELIYEAMAGIAKKIIGE